MPARRKPPTPDQLYLELSLVTVAIGEHGSDLQKLITLLRQANALCAWLQRPRQPPAAVTAPRPPRSRQPMLTHDIYDMVLTIAGYAVPYIHLDRKLRATLLAADETPRPEIAYILRDELAMHPAGRLPGDHRAHSAIHRIGLAEWEAKSDRMVVDELDAITREIAACSSPSPLMLSPEDGDQGTRP